MKLALLILLLAATASADPFTGGNPCNSGEANLLSASGVTAGTTPVMMASGVASQQIWVCALNVQGVSGTTPTFGLVYGTGSNCVVGTTPITPLFATVANTLLAFSGPFTLIPPGNQVCYRNGGTNPVQNFMMSYIQK